MNVCLNFVEFGLSFPNLKVLMLKCLEVFTLKNIKIINDSVVGFTSKDI